MCKRTEWKLFVVFNVLAFLFELALIDYLLF